MRILILAPQEFYADRGTPIAVDLLARTLVDQGHEVEVLTYHLGSAPSCPGVVVHRVPRVPFVRAVPPGLSLRKLVCDTVLFASMAALLARRRFDVVHAVEESVFMAMAAHAVLGLPYVYDMDSSLADQVQAKLPLLRPLAPLLRALERAAVRRSEAVAPVCDALARLARRYGARRLVVLRDVSLLDERAGASGGEAGGARLELGLSPEDGPVVMYVGSLERYQGIDLLLEAFALAAARLPALRLAVVGGAPPALARYRRLAARLALGDRVRFLGPRPAGQLGRYLAAADILVSPRLSGENTPMKIYSYLHAGRAVLATDLPTHTQVLDAGVALLAAPEPAPFAEALVRLAGDPRLRARLGEAARRRAEAKHSRAAFAAQVAELYGCSGAAAGLPAAPAAPGAGVPR